MDESSYPEFDSDVVEAHQTYVDAINSNDTDRVMACYDKDAAVLPPDEPIFEGHEHIRRWVKKYFQKSKTHWRKISKVIWVAGDYGFDQGVDYAVDIPLIERDGVRIEGGPTQSFSVKGILIYKRQEDGTLKVYRDIFNFNSPPTAVPLQEPGEDREKCEPVHAPQASGKRDPDVVKAHDAYVDAINSNNADLVMDCYDKDAAVMPPDTPLVAGHEALRNWVTKYFQESKTEWKKESKVLWTAGDYGFDQGDDYGVDTPRKGGPAESFTVKGILIYKRQESGEFKVFRDIWNHNCQPKLTRIERC